MWEIKEQKKEKEKDTKSNIRQRHQGNLFLSATRHGNSGRRVHARAHATRVRLGAVHPRSKVPGRLGGRVVAEHSMLKLHSCGVKEEKRVALPGSQQLERGGKELQCYMVAGVQRGSVLDSIWRSSTAATCKAGARNNTTENNSSPWHVYKCAAVASSQL